ncbi:MAG: M48 family metallopeptidase [Gammaproteobacteria bacterium]
MDFFEHQARARRRTRSLAILFVLAVALVTLAVTLVVAITMHLLGSGDQVVDLSGGGWLKNDPAMLWKTAIGTVLFIVIASLYRLAQLRDGGARVAEALGGNLVSAEDTEPGRRRLYNVVEEMAIASGLPVPAVYVLEHEPGINAFAAGMTPSDAAVAVTRGSIDQLDRDELQGVVAHEFSHILHGDMRLNSLLMGYLFGILAVGMVGRSVLRSGGRRGFRSGRSRGGGVLVVAGLGLVIIGSAGVFIGRIIQAAVCRQREFLADASAVQFSRQSGGLAGALRKIAGGKGRSFLATGRAEEVSHMLIAPGRNFLAGLFATHPPVDARIRALGHVLDSTPESPATRPEATQASEMTSGLADSGPSPSAGPASGAATASEAPVSGLAALTPDAVTQAVGRPGEPQVAFAAGLEEMLPLAVWDAAHHRAGAVPLIMAMLMATDDTIREHQLALLEVRFGKPLVSETVALERGIRTLGHNLRLSLLDLTFPALRSMNPARREFLLETVDRMIEIDGQVAPFEAAMAGALRSRIRDLEPESKRRSASDQHASQAAVSLLAGFAIEGHARPEAASRAFAAGLDALGPLAPAVRPALPANAPGGAEMREALKRLDSLQPALKRELVRALATAAASDGRYNSRELEILRAVCSIIHCPLPPLALEPESDTR